MTTTKKKIAVKIFLGVILGLTTLITLSILTDEFIVSLNKNIILVDTTWLLIFFFYRFVYTAIGGFVTAKIAKEKPYLWAEILGGIVASAYLYGLYTFWNQGMNVDFIVLALTGFIAACIGAYIASSDKRVLIWKKLLKREKPLKKEEEIKEETPSNLAKESLKEEIPVEKVPTKKVEKDTTPPLPKRNTWKTEEMKKTTKKEEVKTSKTPTKTKKETPKEEKTTKVTPKKPQTKKPTQKKSNA